MVISCQLPCRQSVYNGICATSQIAFSAKNTNAAFAASLAKATFFRNGIVWIMEI